MVLQLDLFRACLCVSSRFFILSQLTERLLACLSEPFGGGNDVLLCLSRHELVLAVGLGLTLCF